MLSGNTIQLQEVQQERRKTRMPLQPATIEETGLSTQFLLELVVKTLFLNGQLRLLDLVEALRLPFAVIQPLMTFVRNERLCEVTRSGEAETATVYNLTDLGRKRAEDYLQKSHYVGPAPVSLHAYITQVHAQSVAQMGVTRDQMTQAFADLIIDDGLRHQFGAAMNSGHAIFVYGPAGSGKTYIAEHLARLLSGNVAIPHAILVDNEVIQIFDPLIHRPMLQESALAGSGLVLERRKSSDSRWVMCQRPVVKTGGELTLKMLDLDFDETARFYQAPPQVRANNGLMIIDDLGRQLAPAVEIMNRWIVPLDRHVDYLALHTGKKFILPFDVIVVFSTNMPPSKLADEAFLRRLGYKIYIGALDIQAYRTLVMQVCAELNIPFDEQGFDYLLQRHQQESKPLYACIPRDILQQVTDVAKYEGVAAEMNNALIDWAWANYFTHD